MPRNTFGLLRKALSFLLIAGILVISVPITASAVMGYNISNGDVNITTGVYNHAITGSSAEHSITVNAPGQTVNITLEDLNISFSEPYLKRPINIVAGTVNLALWGNNVLKSGGGYAGICNNGNPLVIQEDMKTSGEDTLTIYDSGHGAGIGGDDFSKGGRNITIHSGHIEIHTQSGAAIGGGQGAAGENILIDGGTIIADSNGGAGIGGGSCGQGNNIRIAGGTITATSYMGAGIGGGRFSSASDIIIDGGSVKASGTSGIAIGGGNAAITPKNSSGNDVLLVTKDSLSDTEKSNLSNISYNTAGASKIDGTYYLYLPVYPITYNTDGGTHGNPSSYHVLSDITLTDAKKTAYAFTGWFDAQTGGNKITHISPGNTGSKTFYAQWKSLPVLQSIIAPEPITGVANGTAKTSSALGLPLAVTLKTNNGDVGASLIWDMVSCAYEVSSTAAQTFTVNGTVTLPGGVVNTNSVSLTTKINVTVLAKPVTDKVLQSIIAPEPITGVANGTAKTSSALGLPLAVTLKTNNGDVGASVVWDVASCAYEVSSTDAQTFTVNGTVTLPGGVVNTNSVSLTTTISVSVKKASSGGSSSSGGSTTPKYSVYSDTSPNGTVTLSAISVDPGGSVTVTITPDRGYRIADVLINGVSVGGVSSYTIKGVSKNTTVKVVFEKVKEDNVWVNTYSDVEESAWYYHYVSYVSQKGLMNGDGKQFNPDDDMTRAMVVTVLLRLSGDTGNFDNTFSDVDSDAWYEQAVAWASANGIASGVGGNSFAPEISLTREQLAVMLYNYAKYKGLNVSIGENTNILSYNDAASISDYAYTALQWACGSVIINGDGNGKLNPKSFATRAEVAAMLERFIKCYALD